MSNHPFRRSKQHEQPSDANRLELEWTTKSGLLLNLGLQDINAANTLLELLSFEVADAIEAVRCTAWLRPRIFSSTKTPPPLACNAWNRKYPPVPRSRSRLSPSLCLHPQWPI